MPLVCLQVDAETGASLEALVTWSANASSAKLRGPARVATGAAMLRVRRHLHATPTTEFFPIRARWSGSLVGRAGSKETQRDGHRDATMHDTPPLSSALHERSLTCRLRVVSRCRSEAVSLRRRAITAKEVASDNSIRQAERAAGSGAKRRGEKGESSSGSFPSSTQVATSLAVCGVRRMPFRWCPLAR